MPDHLAHYPPTQHTEHLSRMLAVCTDHTQCSDVVEGGQCRGEESAGLLAQGRVEESPGQGGVELGDKEETHT